MEKKLEPSCGLRGFQSEEKRNIKATVCLLSSGRRTVTSQKSWDKCRGIEKWGGNSRRWPQWSPQRATAVRKDGDAHVSCHRLFLLHWRWSGGKEWLWIWNNADILVEGVFGECVRWGVWICTCLISCCGTFHGLSCIGTLHCIINVRNGYLPINSDKRCPSHCLPQNISESMVRCLVFYLCV